MKYKTYTHPGQEQMQVEVIKASISPNRIPIYTIRMRYPRPIHGEIMTHRVFGRNARSSRAVPVKTMLNEVRTIPYVPWHWGKNQKGMQADEECNAKVKIRNIHLDYDEENSFGLTHDLVKREKAWLYARDVAADMAEAFMNAGYHKQNPNRLLEPFSWMDTLITSTDWNNFLWLRQHKDAEPHLQDLANLIAQAIEEAELNELLIGMWHLPYITEEDINFVMSNCAYIPPSPVDLQEIEQFLLKISAARCARISYKPFDGDASYERELERYDLLVTSDRVHASPLEHQAKPDEQFDNEWMYPKLHGNLNGYIQARKLIPNECYKAD